MIAIDGVGGSGKTTLAESLVKELQDCVIIQLDDFYSPVLHTTDIVRLKDQLLLPLYNHQEAKYQIFEWKTNSFSDWHILSPKGIFIFEGVYALDKNIRDYYDFKIWINYPADLGFKRGIARDRERDGIDNSDQWKKIWMPLEEKYRIEQEPENTANFIIDGENIFEK